MPPTAAGIEAAKRSDAEWREKLDGLENQMLGKELKER